MIDQAEAVLQYRFQREALLVEALTHASSADDRRQSNERMEFLGDAILGYVVCEYLYTAFPHLFEGDLTKIKSTVVSRTTCARISKAINLSGLLNLGKGMAGRPGLPQSVAAAVLEAIIAAIYLDGGMDAVKPFILRHMEPLILEAADSTHHQNFKSVLQQHAQRHLPASPSYVLLDEKGPDHAKCFEVCVQINGTRYDSAWANSKKQAEQKAALNALASLGLVAVDDAGEVHMLR